LALILTNEVCFQAFITVSQTFSLSVYLVRDLSFKSQSVKSAKMIKSQESGKLLLCLLPSKKQNGDEHSCRNRAI